jgi:hypothetical protein
VIQLLESAGADDEHYLISGSAEKRIRNVHIIIGVSVLILEFLLIPIEDWILSPGLVIPVFIIITGAFYSLTTSMESARLLLTNVIRPRLDGIYEVTKEREAEYYGCKKAIKVAILLQAYVGAIILTWLWVTLNTLGANPVWGMLWLIPGFLMLLFAASGIAGHVLKRTKYKDVRPFLDVEVAWMMERRKRNRS